MSIKPDSIVKKGIKAKWVWLGVFLFCGVIETAAAEPDIIVQKGINTISGKSPRWASDEIVVKFKPGVTDQTSQRIHQRHGTKLLQKGLGGGFQRLRIAAGAAPEDIVKKYKAENDVEYAEFNYYVHALMTPNDPYFLYQWNFNNSLNGGIHMPAAWDIQTGNPSVIVAVVDTGAAYENYNGFVQAPDLAATSFVPGQNFVADPNTAHANDDNGHGTHVTGTIAQSTNNSLGVTGIAFHCSIMPVKVLDSSGSGTDTAVANGIYFAADHGARVINMSLGGTADTLVLHDAVAYAYNKGVTIVCAAGNDYQSGNPVTYPAAYKPYCIGVGATQYDRTRAFYSNTGSYVDIAAPGGNTVVDQNQDGYGDGIVQQTFQLNPTQFHYYFFMGTSMATPHVSGVAALLISQGAAGPDRIRNILQNTADDLGTPGWDPQYGWGQVNAVAALTCVIPGDLNGDCRVDLADLDILAQHWLENTCTPADSFCGGADITQNGFVDFEDFAQIADYWTP
jgi:serine protease